MDIRVKLICKCLSLQRQKEYFLIYTLLFRFWELSQAANISSLRICLIMHIAQSNPGVLDIKHQLQRLRFICSVYYAISFLHFQQGYHEYMRKFRLSSYSVMRGNVYVFKFPVRGTKISSIRHAQGVGRQGDDCMSRKEHIIAWWKSFRQGLWKLFETIEKRS